MNQSPFVSSTLSTIKTLSGAPATIMLAMFLASGPVGRNDLTMATSYGKDKIAQGLEILSAMGIVQNHRRYRGWTLTSRARQLILPVDNSAEIVDNPVDNLLVSPQEYAGRSAQSTSPIIITTTIDSSKGGGLKTIDPAKSAQATSPWNEKKNIAKVQALLKAGVMKNGRTEKLLALAHITPLYIQAHHRCLVESKRGRETGLLITILESGAPAPKLRANGHTIQCNCEDCLRYKYREDPYSNHLS